VFRELVNADSWLIKLLMMVCGFRVLCGSVCEFGTLAAVHFLNILLRSVD
jgi:hypothetical protein